MMMKEMTNNMVYILFLLTILMFSKTHVMNNLITIELMIITMLMMMFKAMSTMKMENFIILYFIIITICESMIGLSLMIAMIRTHSNDYMKSLSIMQF